MFLSEAAGPLYTRSNCCYLAMNSIARSAKDGSEAVVLEKGGSRSRALAWFLEIATRLGCIRGYVPIYSAEFEVCVYEFKVPAPQQQCDCCSSLNTAAGPAGVLSYNGS